MGGRMMLASVSHRPVGVPGVGQGASKEACSGSNGWDGRIGKRSQRTRSPDTLCPTEPVTLPVVRTRTRTGTHQR